MHLATEGTYTGSYSGATLDGSDMWNAITTNSATAHTSIVHFASKKSTSACVQMNMVKYNYLEALVTVASPQTVFASDAKPGDARMLCDNVGALTGTDDDSTVPSPTAKPTAKPTAAPSTAASVPTAKPSAAPSAAAGVPTAKPTSSPSAAKVPTAKPTAAPAAARPTMRPMLRPPSRTAAAAEMLSVTARIQAVFEAVRDSLFYNVTNIFV
jgi:cytoskeletal protein RodZ